MGRGFFPPESEFLGARMGLPRSGSGWTLLDLARYEWRIPMWLGEPLHMLFGRFCGGVTLLFVMGTLGLLASAGSGSKDMLRIPRGDLFLVLAAWVLLCGCVLDRRVTIFTYKAAVLLELVACAAVWRVLWERLKARQGAEFLIGMPFLVYALAMPSALWEALNTVVGRGK